MSTSEPATWGDLPPNPPRNNAGGNCTLVGGAITGREHLTPCTCGEHDAVCDACGYKITVGPSGIEYGHARARNIGPDEDGVRRDCPHRPPACDPGPSGHSRGGQA